MSESSPAPAAETPETPTPKPAFRLAMMRLADLKDAPYNPRTISGTSLSALRKSVARFGLVEPIVWNEVTGNIVGGHQRKQAMLANGETAALVLIGRWSETEEKALNITLNNPNVQGQFTEGLGSLVDELQMTFDMFGDLQMGLFDKKPKEAPAEFAKYDETIETKHTCPKCGYEWS